MSPTNTTIRYGENQKKSIPTKKSPNAPKRFFKSAFIIYSSSKHPEIRQRLKEEGTQTTNVAKLVSEDWKNLTPDERIEWETKANEEKERFEAKKKATYTGPSTVLSSSSGGGSKRAKDPEAPKRPMSAFLAYSNSRRAALKRKHPMFSNAELSRTLSKKWKELPEDERQKYKDEEYELRQKYKVAMKEFREKVHKREQEAENQRQQQQQEMKKLRQELEKANALAAAATDLSSLRERHHQRHQQLVQQQQLLSDMNRRSMLFGGGNAAALAGMNTSSNPYLAAEATYQED